MTNIYSFDPDCILHSYFQFKSFPEKEREREREERAQIGERERKEEERAGDRRAARSSNERAPHRSRLRARSSIAPLDDCDRRSRRSSDDHTDLASDLATSAPLIDRDCERARRSRPSTIAIVDRAARRMITPISPPISLLPCDLIFSSAARSQFDRIRLIFLLGFVSSVNECGIDSLSACLQLRKCVENWSYKAFSVKMFE